MTHTGIGTCVRVRAAVVVGTGRSSHKSKSWGSSIGRYRSSHRSKSKGRSSGRYMSSHRTKSKGRSSVK